MSYMTVGVSGSDSPCKLMALYPACNCFTEIAFIFVTVLHRCYNVIACMFVPSAFGTQIQMLES